MLFRIVDVFFLKFFNFLFICVLYWFWLYEIFVKFFLILLNLLLVVLNFFWNFIVFFFNFWFLVFSNCILFFKFEIFFFVLLSCLLLVDMFFFILIIFFMRLWIFFISDIWIRVFWFNNCLKILVFEFFDLFCSVLFWVFLLVRIDK